MTRTLLLFFISRMSDVSAELWKEFEESAEAIKGLKKVSQASKLA